MTRTPLASTLFALIPLAALAWPLFHVLKPANTVKDTPPSAPEDSASAFTLIQFFSAHPFELLEFFQDGQVIQISPENPEIEIPLSLITDEEHHTLSFQVNIQWPESTPESALRIEASPEFLETQTKTIWGMNEALEELTFTWETD